MSKEDESSAESDYEKAYKAMCKKCTWPWHMAETVENCVGKTIKFSKQITIKPNVLLLVFTDDSFLMLTSDYDKMYTSVTMEIPDNKNVQQLLIEAKLVSRKKVNEKNSFHKKRELEVEKEIELKELDRLMKKYKS